jgi:hypothetical protein
MDLKATLSERFDKKTVSDYVKANPSAFEELFELAMQPDNPFSWRAAWILNASMRKNDPRLTPQISRIINATTKGNQSIQRELLKTLLRLTPSEDEEGLVFDLAVTLWQDISKPPAVRGTAFKHMIHIASKHPEIKNEIPFLTQSHYIESLSPGIKRSVEKMIRKTQ